MDATQIANVHSMVNCVTWSCDLKRAHGTISNSNRSWLMDVSSPRPLCIGSPFAQESALFRGNQKLDLLAALLEMGAWSHAEVLLGRLQPIAPACVWGATGMRSVIMGCCYCSSLWPGHACSARDPMVSPRHLPCLVCLAGSGRLFIQCDM